MFSGVSIRAEKERKTVNCEHHQRAAAAADGVDSFVDVLFLSPHSSS